jgi:superfamily II DNA or RNA helicase
VAVTSLLTAAHVRALAGYSFPRGEAYLREGRVLTCELRSGRVEGLVSGSDDYEVSIYEDDGELFSDCTCPVGGPGQFCKHAVALALRFIDGGPAPITAPASTGPAFGTLRELDAWCAEHGVSHELQVAADVIGPELFEAVPSARGVLQFVLARWALRDIGSLEGCARYLGVQALRRPAAEAVARRLARAADDVRTATAEESAPREVPTEPILSKLWAKLLELRGVARRTASPRSRSYRANGTLRFDAKTGGLQWIDPAPIQLMQQTFMRATAEARLVPSPALKLSCICKRDTCTHGLALLDAALDLVADPLRVVEARHIADELMRPGWERALAELAAHEDRQSRPRSEIELWWLVEHELGTVTLTALVKKQLKKGGTSTGTRMNALRLLDEHADALSETDLTIAQHLAAWQPGRRGTTYPARAFTALAGHPRVAVDHDPDLQLNVRRLALGFTAMPSGNEIRLEPSLDGARFSPRLLAPLLQVFAPGEPLIVLEPEQGHCLVVDVTDDARKLWSVLERYGDTFPEESHDKLMDRLARMPREMPIVVPESLLGSKLSERPVVVLRMRLTIEGTLELEPFIRPALGAPLYPPSTGPRDVLVSRHGNRHYARRDLGAELPLVAGLLARVLPESAEEGPPGCWQISDVDAALAVVAAVQHPPDGLEAEWIDRKPVVVRSGGVNTLNITVERKRDWFGIDGDLKVESGRVELAVLLDAARQQRRFVRLDDRRWVELSEAVRQRLTAIADQTFTTKNALELSPGAVPVIRALELAGANVEAAPSWQLLGERLAMAERLRPRPPTTLTATLRPYQVEGHAWLARLAAWGAGACLADDMGLGKTIQAIALLLDRGKLGPALVIAPTSVTLNWVDELRRFAPSLNPVLYGEAPDRAACLASLGKRDVLILSYGLLVRDIDQLAARTFGTLVLDEAQALKNPQTRRAKAARLLDAGFRIAMSGTPLENHLGELWSLFSIVFPGLLGSFEQFRTRFGLPIERDKNAEARAALSRVIRPFLLRRTKAEVATDLPARTEIFVPISLSSDEAQLYEDARLAAVAQLDKKSGMRDEQRRFQVLAALTRLRLLASHPRLYDPASPVASSKMQRMCELAEELRSEGHRALIFSQFTTHLALAREALDAAGITYLYLDGTTTARARADLIARFQAGEGDVFLISLKAGGTGINLTAADYVIHLDPWWNPAVEDQATDRAHRIGQTKPVTVYRLVSRGTVEEKILAMHGDKRALVAGVLEGTGVAGRLTTRDLMSLVGDQPLTALGRRPNAQA